MEIVIILVFIAIVIFAFSFSRTKKKKDPVSVVNEKVEKKEEKKEKKEETMLEIEDFDKDEYVNSVFDSAFYSIQVDKWDIENKYDEIIFSRSTKNGHRVISATLTFKFSFERPESDYKKPKVFTMKSITCSTTGCYDTFKYQRTISPDVLKFVYDCYSNWKNSKNEALKKSADSSLDQIRSILGKSSERGAKLDELLS